jgi:hypothetical protein
MPIIHGNRVDSSSAVFLLKTVVIRFTSSPGLVLRDVARSMTFSTGRRSASVCE